MKRSKIVHLTHSTTIGNERFNFTCCDLEPAVLGTSFFKQHYWEIECILTGLSPQCSLILTHDRFYGAL
jgi:hypothetical protein